MGLNPEVCGENPANIRLSYSTFQRVEGKLHAFLTATQHIEDLKKRDRVERFAFAFIATGRN
jgi:hypothetical protein